MLRFRPELFSCEKARRLWQTAKSYLQGDRICPRFGVVGIFIVLVLIALACTKASPTATTIPTPNNETAVARGGATSPYSNTFPNLHASTDLYATSYLYAAAHGNNVASPYPGT